MLKYLRNLLITAAVTVNSIPVLAAEQPPSTSTWPAVTRMADLGPKQFSAMRTGVFSSKAMPYRAELSEMLIHDRTDKPAASMFLTSFVASPENDARPVLFLFNGGPGGSSNALRFGALGPQRLKKFSMAAIGDPATPVVTNDDTILDTADIVFIDAPETGYGRPLPGSDPKTFRGNDGDASAFVQSILRWLHDHHREKSPIFLAGESYGTVRAVLLARELRAATPQVNLSGIILVSQALWYNGPTSNTIKRVPDPVAAVNSLPDIAALAWYHGTIDNQRQTLEQAIRAAQAYALGDYASAMIAGNRLPAAEQERVAARLATLTGVPAPVWLAGKLRLDNVRRQLLASRHLALGQFDGRETEPLEGVPEDDDRDARAMMRGLTHASEVTNGELFHADGLPDYRSVASSHMGDFERSWTFIAAPAAGPELILREQMTVNPRLRLMVAQGVFDTTTTFGETDFEFGQIGAPRERTRFAYYPGGHMLYSDDAGRRAFLDDLRDFIADRPTASRPFPQPVPGRAFP